LQHNTSKPSDAFYFYLQPYANMFAAVSGKSKEPRIAGLDVLCCGE